MFVCFFFDECTLKSVHLSGLSKAVDSASLYTACREQLCHENSLQRRQPFTGEGSWFIYSCREFLQEVAALCNGKITMSPTNKASQ